MLAKIKIISFSTNTRAPGGCVHNLLLQVFVFREPPAANSCEPGWKVWATDKAPPHGWRFLLSLQSTGSRSLTVCVSRDFGQLAWDSREHTYEVVQAERPKLCQPRMPLAISTRMSHIWYHTDGHEQRKRVA